MRSKPYILVTCDNCYDAIEIELTALAEGNYNVFLLAGCGYDDRRVNIELERNDWNSDNDLCPICKRLRVEDI